MFISDQLIRASGNSLWVAFKPLNYESSFVGNITVHGKCKKFLKHFLPFKYLFI